MILYYRKKQPLHYYIIKYKSLLLKVFILHQYYIRQYFQVITIQLEHTGRKTCLYFLFLNHGCFLLTRQHSFMAELLRCTFIHPYFFVRAEEFHGIPEKIGISQNSFLSKLYFISQHRCIALLYRIPLGNFNCVLCSTHQISSSRRDLISVAGKKIHA